MLRASRNPTSWWGHIVWVTLSVKMLPIIPHNSPFTHLHLGYVCVQFTAEDTGRRIRVNLYCSSPALFVWLDVDDIPGFFDDNGFLMIFEKYTVYFIKLGTTSIQEFTTKLRITSLRDIYWVCAVLVWERVINGVCVSYWSFWMF